MKSTIVYEMHVDYLKESYKEMASHERKWFTIEEAVSMLSEQNSPEAAFFDSFVEKKVRQFLISTKTVNKVQFKDFYLENKI